MMIPIAFAVSMEEPPPMVIGLKVNTSGDVEMVKTIATTAGITAAGFTEFELVEAASIVVSGADELNTIFGTQDKKAGITLKFTPDVLGDGAVNYFTERSSRLKLLELLIISMY